MATVPATSNRIVTITPDNDGNVLEIGPAGTISQVATFALQFNPSLSFSGTIAIVGREAGTAAKDANMPFLRVPYRRVNIGGVASDWTFVSDVITGPALIQVPANGLSVGLMVSCNFGSCPVAILDLQGPGAV